MKKFVFLFVVYFCVACTDRVETDDAANLQTLSTDIPAEEAFPNVEKEVYVTSSGISLGKIDTIYVLQGDVILSPDQVAALDDPQT